jgi:hypothetical protein
VVVVGTDEDVLLGARPTRDHRAKVRERLVEGLAIGVAPRFGSEAGCDLRQGVDQKLRGLRASRGAGATPGQRVVGQPAHVGLDLARNRRCCRDLGG